MWQLNPLGKVPVLLHDGNTIFESLITCEYVDEVFPGAKIHSEEASERARDRMMVELFNKVIMPQMRFKSKFSFLIWVAKKLLVPSIGFVLNRIPSVMNKLGTLYKRIS